jgi:sphingosine kinase
MSRFEMLKSFDGAEKGAAYWQDKVRIFLDLHLPTIADHLLKAQYIKATAYRLRPMQEDGNLSIDGERFPFQEYYAEVHRGLATVLSMNGRYSVDFTLKPPGSA